jgi:glycosyltransferase involved in cell wall biosynthesis
MSHDRTTTPTIGIIIPTYERAEALALVLDSLMAQTYRHFKVVVADDGSRIQTRKLVERVARDGHLPLTHIWQEDQGYRLAAIRNRAIAAIDTEYLIFIDGDCLARPNFVARHARLAERGWFVRGSRVSLGRTLTNEVLTRNARVHEWNTLRWLTQRLRRRADRFTPLLSVPLGPLRKILPHAWDGAKGCNLAVWRDDALAINGFDESYKGWGAEDNDFVVRLIKRGIYRKDGRYAVPVLHLWHPQRTPESDNYDRFAKRRAGLGSWIERGINQYL